MNGNKIMSYGTNQVDGGGTNVKHFGNYEMSNDQKLISQIK